MFISSIFCNIQGQEGLLSDIFEIGIQICISGRELSSSTCPQWHMKSTMSVAIENIQVNGSSLYPFITFCRES